MDKKLNQILAGSEEKEHLLKVLETELSNKDLLKEIVNRAEQLYKDGRSDLEVCDLLTNFVYEKMACVEDNEFFDEVDFVLESFVIPKLNENDLSD